MDSESKKTKRDQDHRSIFRSVITIDERGQMVITKEIRNAINLQPGDKLAVFTAESPCEDANPKIVLVKVDDILDSNRVSQIVG